MPNRQTALWIVSILVYAFLYIPLIIVVTFSFNDSKLNTEWVGFTLHWYKALLNNHEMLLAARNSLISAIRPIWAAPKVRPDTSHTCRWRKPLL